MSEQQGVYVVDGIDWESITGERIKRGETRVLMEVTNYQELANKLAQLTARWAVLTSELDKSVVETIERVSDENQRLRELLREALPIVRHSVDERFNVELPTYQNRLQLRDRIKAATGES